MLAVRAEQAELAAELIEPDGSAWRSLVLELGSLGVTPAQWGLGTFDLVEEARRT